MELTNQQTGTEIIHTVYIGGGTPSLLTTGEIEHLIKQVKTNFTVSDTAEITMEANPDDIEPDTLESWLKTGVNRLSLGVQSFNDTELKWMNRAHNSGQSIKSIDDIIAAGFTNFSVDLIYGSPLLDNDGFKKNVEMLLQKNVPHISAYALTVEPRTALFKMMAAKKTAPVDENRQAEQFDILVSMLEGAGYEHYEISNFAKPGFRSRHNSSYWQGLQYFGFGPAAHSYNGKNIRRWNIANNALYIKSIDQNIIPFEEEMLTSVQQINEYIMIALRTSEGLDLGNIKKRFDENYAEKILEKAGKYISTKKIETSGTTLVLTRTGKFFADGIAADLFF